MCDSLCSVQSDRTLFAKSSDRPPDEVQLIEAHPARRSDGSLHTQYLVLPDLGAPAILAARPDWLWGFEHGVNVHRVAIGNQQVWTNDDPGADAPALIGMDLVRLGLERGRTAGEALEVITSLLDRHGQGGIADLAAAKAYYSSFLIADPQSAWVLETSGRSWAARPVSAGGAAVSNRISIGTDFTRASADVAATGDFDRWRRASSPTAHADKRLALTRPAAEATDPLPGPGDLAALLRHHGGRSWGNPVGADPSVDALPPAIIDRLGTGVSLCLHLRGVQATTSSMITSLPRDPDETMRAWVAPGSPCVSVFVPAFPVDGIAPELGLASTWQRFARLRDRIDRARDTTSDQTGPDPLTEVRGVLGPLEAALWDEADEMAVRSPAARTTWARGLWPRVDAALGRLGV